MNKTKIKCTCCFRTAEVAGTHEFIRIQKCRNLTTIETSHRPHPQISARDMSKIELWDEGKKRFVPLIEA